MVGAAMAEFQLVGLAAHGQAEQLVAQADAEDGLLADQLADVGHLRVQRLGIAGAVGEEDAVGLERQHVFGGSERRNHRDAAAGLHQAAQDVVLDAEIVGHHVEARLGRRGRPARRASRRPPAWSTRSGSAVVTRLARSRPAMVGMARAFSTSCCGVGFDGREHAAHHAAGAQMADQRARVEIGDHRDAARCQKLRWPPSSERQLLAMAENSRTTRPSM